MYTLCFINLSTRKRSFTVFFLKKKLGVTGRSTGSHRMLGPCVRCSEVSHMSTFESRVLISNGYFQTTGHSQVSTRRVWYPPDTYAERVAKRFDQRTLSTRHSLMCPVLCQKPSQSCLLTLTTIGHSNSRPPASGAERPVHTWARHDSTPDAKPSVRCLCALRPVPRLSKEFHRRNRKYTFYFLKTLNPASPCGRKRGTQTPSTLGTPPPLQMC